MTILMIGYEKAAKQHLELSLIKPFRCFLWK